MDGFDRLELSRDWSAGSFEIKRSVTLGLSSKYRDNMTCSLSVFRDVTTSVTTFWLRYPAQNSFVGDLVSVLKGIAFPFNHIMLMASLLVVQHTS